MGRRWCCKGISRRVRCADVPLDGGADTPLTSLTCHPAESPPMQVVELREENARLRERLRHFEPAPAPASRKPSGSGESAGGPLQQQASAPPSAQPPSGVPSQLSM